MAAPGTDEKDQSSQASAPSKTATPAPKAQPAAPARRRGGFVSKLFLSVLILLIVLGIAGYGALIFRDTDERVGVAANYVEDGIAEAQAALDKAKATLAELTGEPAPPPSPRFTLRRSAPPAQPSEPAPAPQKLAEVKEPEAPAAPVETPAAPEPPKTVEVAPAPAPAPAPPALVAAEPVKPAAPAAPAAEAVDADGFTARDLIAALEGRIEALDNEIAALRAKLDAPKNESRAAPDTEAAKPPPVIDGGGAAVVVAFALQRELEAGKPYATELAALSRLGGEPAPAPVLAEFAEKGAPTGAQLLETFLPLAKRLKGQEHGAQDSGDLAGHLLEGASKLVKVRPSGQAHPESVEGKLHKIEAALSHDDFAAAAAAFESLPEAAKTEAREFGDALGRRAEAARAADDLLRGAIAALGSGK